MKKSNRTFKLYFILLLNFLFLSAINAQTYKILVFSKTTGFRHSSIDDGKTMITDLGKNNGWTTDFTENGADFNDQNLAKYKAVVWLQTSGSSLLNDTQKTAFEKYIRNGGGFVGIHAASDAYREGTWKWYNDLVGAIVQTSPNHTANGYKGTMDVLDTANPIVNHLGKTWEKPEEYYYWKINGGYLYSGNKVLLKVRSTGNNSYDEPRPMTWYKEYDGGRSFYTALGHDDKDYQETKFKELINKAIKWAAKSTNLGLDDFSFSDNQNELLIFPNPTKTTATIKNVPENTTIKVIDLLGKVVLEKQTQQSGNVVLDINNIKSGIYAVKYDKNGYTKSQKLIIEN